jgi:hypothetical protein
MDQAEFKQLMPIGYSLDPELALFTLIQVPKKLA